MQLPQVSRLGWTLASPVIFLVYSCTSDEITVEIYIYQKVLRTCNKTIWKCSQTVHKRSAIYYNNCQASEDFTLGTF
jgi:hypothetical protein